MLYVLQHLFVRRFVTLQLIGDDYPWGKGVVEPDTVGDDFGGKAMTRIHKQNVANRTQGVQFSYFTVKLTIPPKAINEFKADEELPQKGNY